MKIIGIIPARWASTRFPGKPLTNINGKTMIRRVFEQASRCPKLDMVLVATDDERIVHEVESFGGQVVMTGTHHTSGTDRCLEALDQCVRPFDAVINIQGDEPYVNPDHIALLAETISRPGVQIATLVSPVANNEELFNPNVVKVVVGQDGNALYFSRQPIPYLRGTEAADWLNIHTFYRHIGMYAYAADVLRKITHLPVSPLERAESLEQLRWLENGFRIAVALVEKAMPGVDTPEDVDKLRNIF
ncbi:MAG: 3-deoxy-manno-octulosonate cytidylyltransferase [Bacteroidetes bacterium]|nr:3-deoxy-manno-octulosonate cytidylyltransferase [Bacteroidota bacterium]